MLCYMDFISYLECTRLEPKNDIFSRFERSHRDEAFKQKDDTLILQY